MYYLDYSDNNGFNYQEKFNSWLEAHDNARELRKQGCCNFLISQCE